MQAPSPLPPRLLDVLFAVSAASLLLCAVLTVAPPRSDARRAVVLVVLGAVLVALWHRRRGRAQRSATIGFALVAFVVAFAGDNLLAMVTVLCAVVLLVLDVGLGGGAIMVGALLTVQAIALVLAGGGLEDILFEVAAAGTILVFVLSVALVVRRSASESAERARLLQERDAANARLEAANHRLRAGVEAEKELVLAQERARAARELHDGLGHRLTAVTMSLDFAQRVHRTAPDRAWAEVAAARQTAQDAIAEMRLWVRALSPVSLDGFDGLHALDAVADAFRGTGLDVRLVVHGAERPVSTETLLFCYRFVQEGLTNAVRHAHAAAVSIDVEFCDDELRLTLEDDGAVRGAAPARIDPGFGLRSLSERAVALGGGVDIGPADGGTRLAARLPLPGSGVGAAAIDGAGHAELVRA